MELPRPDPCTLKSCTAQLPSSTMRPECAHKGALTLWKEKTLHMAKRKWEAGVVGFRDDQAWLPSRKKREGEGGQGL